MTDIYLTTESQDLAVSVGNSPIIAMRLAHKPYDHESNVKNQDTYDIDSYGILLDFTCDSENTYADLITNLNKLFPNLYNIYSRSDSVLSIYIARDNFDNNIAPILKTLSKAELLNDEFAERRLLARSAKHVLLFMPQLFSPSCEEMASPFHKIKFLNKTNTANIVSSAIDEEVSLAANLNISNNDLVTPKMS